MVTTVWFVLLAATLAAYVVFDGFDLGVGVVYLHASGDEDGRRRLLRAIGPVWDGNEVWLLAAGGTVFFAFPSVFAATASGLYLPVTVGIWLLIGRGLAIELRNHLDSPAWAPFWDVLFAGSSLVLAFVFGAALGNVVRGVPLDASGRFFEPLWTDFRPTGATGIFDWFTIPVGALSVLALAMHGAAWAILKTDGELRERLRRDLAIATAGVAILAPVVSVLAFHVQPQLSRNLASHPWGFAFPASVALGLVGVVWFARKRSELATFLSSSLFLVGAVASAFFGIYPSILPSSTPGVPGLGIPNAAAAESGLRTALLWWIPGVCLVAGYLAFSYSRFRGKVELGDEGY